jgi:8-oxo-dGTP diphosphatase
MENKKMGIGVGVLVLQNNKILLGKRNDDANKASSLLHGEGTWTMPGGKVDFGETIMTTAKRELFEETGIQANDLEVFCINEEILPDVHFATVGLLLKECSQNPQTKEPIEITE